MTGFNVSVPDHLYTFSFEAAYQHEELRKWMSGYFNNGYLYCAIYVISIFSGQYLMKNRPRFELRKALVIWNVILAIFSIIGASRTYPEFSHILRNYGLYHSVCCSSFLESDKVSGFWAFLFIWSKPFEFGDTAFIVLRKQPLMFLHWYHHITVLLYSWFGYIDSAGSARWFVCMNYSVHAIMYTYFALRAMGYKLPKQLAMLVTTLQLLQMVVGCAVNIWAYQFVQSGAECQVTTLNIWISFLMYFSYLLLFAQFFYKSYLASSQHKNKSEKHLTNKAKAH